MARGSYDTEAMKRGAQQIEQSADSLREIGSSLANLPAGACPPVVDQALDELSRHGRDMIADIRDEATDLSRKMSQAADAYAGLDQSLVRTFRSTR